MTGERILIVDDTPANLRLAKFVLESKGFVVTTATDAADAFRSVATERPALVLLDLQLPGMDGFEVARHLKTDPATKDIVLVAVTAYAMKGDEARARQAGCDAYIAKPIDTRRLANSIAEILTHRDERP